MHASSEPGFDSNSDSGSDSDHELIRSFVRKLVGRYDRRYWLRCAAESRHTDEMWMELGRAGFLGVTIPEEYGGGGLSMARLAVLMEELSTHGVPLLFLVTSSAMGAIPIAKFGTTAQKERYLPKMASGETKFSFAITEPNAGSNSFRIETRARLDGDDYVLRGQKVFISGANEADHMLVVARTTGRDEVPDKRQGMSLFIIDTEADGIEMQPMDTRILAPEKQFHVFFDDVRVQRENLLGAEGQGMRALFDALNPERITIAALSLGIGRYALAKAVEYARTRTVFSVPIGAHQGLAHPLAEVKTKIELAALMTHHAARIFDRGGDAGMYANMAKLAAAEASIEAVDLAIEVHGGSGFTGETDVITLWPLARLMRTAPVSREMILNYIGEHVLGLPRSY